MSESKHTPWTPGPWELSLPDQWPFSLVIKASSGKQLIDAPIAASSSKQKTRQDARDAVGWDFDQVEMMRSAVAEQEASFRLIAAAPEMVELCTAKAAVFRHYEQLHRSKGTPDGEAKADVNAKHAADLEAIVSRIRGEA